MIFLRFGDFTTTQAKGARFMGLGQITTAFVWFTTLAPPELYQIKDGNKLSVRIDLEDHMEFESCRIAKITDSDLVLIEHCQVYDPSIKGAEVIKFSKLLPFVRVA